MLADTYIPSRLLATGAGRYHELPLAKVLYRNMVFSLILGQHFQSINYNKYILSNICVERRIVTSQKLWTMTHDNVSVKIGGMERNFLQIWIHEE